MLFLQSLQLRVEGRLCRVLGSDRPRLGDTTGVGEYGTHKGDHAEAKQAVKGDQIRYAQLVCADRLDLPGLELHHGQRDIRGVHPVAPRDQRDDKQDGQPAAQAPAHVSSANWTK